VSPDELARFRAANPCFKPSFYAVGKYVQAKAYEVLWRRRVHGRKNIPPAGTPVIFAANHRSYVDPGLAGSAVPYPVFFFAKEELFRLPVLGWYMRRVNSIPVRRGENDVAAFKAAMEALKHGHALMLFPEGGRRRDPAKQFRAKAGVGMLACKSGARVVPVGIKNSDRVMQLKRLEVSFGEPVFPPKDADRDEYHKFADEIMRRIKELCL
jgi:1-acyl-sn-glycerol-3-phosphate acyltransferase